MANIAIVNSKVTYLNVAQVITMTAADETTDATAQKFVYTPTGKDGKLVFVINQASGSVAMTTTITAGVGVFGAAAKTDTIPATAGIYMIQIETGKYMLANGTVEISFLPTSGKDLVNDHTLKVGVIELQ